MIRLLRDITCVVHSKEGLESVPEHTCIVHILAQGYTIRAYIAVEPAQSKNFHL